MKGRTIAILLVVGAATFAPSAGAELLKVYDLVGEDKAGDSSNQEVTGVSSGQIANTRTDILSLEMAHDDDIVQFKVNIGALPGGTGGYMYAVHYKVGATTYLTCYTVQWTGGQSAANQENLLGCSRFLGETPAGPVTAAAGVQVATADGKNFVRWEVPKSAIGGAGPAKPITDLVVDTWFRGVSTCCAGSTQHSSYLWNRADRAPDTGTWGYSMAPAAPALSVALAADPASATVGPGSAVPVNVTATLTAGDAAELSFGVDGLPEGWMATFASSNASLNSTVNTTSVALEVLVPATAANMTVTLNVTATTPQNVTANATIVIAVDTALAPTGVEPPATAAPTDNATAPASQASTEDDGGIPVPAWVPVLAIVGAAIVVGRRRRA